MDYRKSAASYAPGLGVFVGRAACLLAVLVVLSPASRAQAPAVPFDRYTAADGLSHNTVLALLQDRRGFLWIGTSDGLDRFDGHTFTTWRHLPGEAGSLCDNVVQALAEAPDGALWLGTPVGLCRFDPVTERFALVPAERPLDFKTLYAEPDGTIWADDPGQGVYRLAPSDERPTLVAGPFLHDAEAVDHVFAGDSAGTLWVAERRVDGSRTRLFRRQGDAFAVVPLPESGWWGGLYAGPSGLWVGAPEAGALHAMPSAPTAATAFLEARDGTLWMGTERGVYRYDPATATGSLLTPAPGASALARSVLALLEDHAGGVWIGTGSGLYRYDPHRKPFVHLGTEVGLPEAPVMAVLADADALWVGTLGGGLVRRDADGPVRPFSGMRPGMPSDRIWALARHPAAPEVVWVGTDDGLLALGPNGQRRVYPLEARADGLRFVYALAPDTRPGHTSLWAGGGHALYRLDARTSTVEERVNLGAIRGISTVQGLLVDRQGVLWIGTEKAGLWRRTPDGTPASVTTPELPANATVWAIHESEVGTLWMGTTAGLVRLRDGRTQRFFDPETLPGGLVYSILEAPDGTLWLGTSRGLARFDPRTERFQLYDTADGVVNVEFDRRAAAVGPDGRFYLGGLGGVTAFDPTAIRDDPVAPPVAITAVHATSPDGTRRFPVQPGQPLHLSHRDDLLTVDFAASNFAAPSQSRYAYRLDGIDTDWIAADDDRRARYSNLPPGRYTFRVRAANNDGVWNEEGAALALVVRPAYWQTAWFKLLVLGALTGLVYTAYRWRVARLLEVERLRLRIASDLHDEIGSKLSSVALMSETVSRRARLAQPEHQRLTEVARVARGLADDLRDIVWLVNPRYDTLDDLVTRLQHTAAALLPETPCTFDVSSEGLDLGLPMERRRNLYLLVREALHNAARHADATRVRVRATRRNGHLCVDVEDDGAGFDPTADGHGEGLRTMADRAGALGGSLAVESTPGGGTAVRLSIPVA